MRYGRIKIQYKKYKRIVKILNKKFKPSSVIVEILPQHNIDENKQN